MAAGHDICLVLTQPDRPAGRGLQPAPSAVKRFAAARGIPVLQPHELKNAEEVERVRALRPDALVVAAYGMLLPQGLLDAGRHGALNIHASLLPRWRGAAPIQRAILAGDAETGVGIMQMAAGMDTGPVRLEGRTPVAGKTAGELAIELSAMGARLMLEVLADTDAYPPVEQASEGVTHAAKIDKAEARLRFDGSAVDAERQVRAFNPAPGAFLPKPYSSVQLAECVRELIDSGRATTIAEN